MSCVYDLPSAHVSASHAMIKSSMSIVFPPYFRNRPPRTNKTLFFRLELVKRNRWASSIVINCFFDDLPVLWRL